MQMINATLDLAEVESGSANYVEQEINVSQLAEDACELFQPVADEKNIKLSFKHGANCKIRGNLQSLQRMLANLLDNALKYTPSDGEVCVELHKENNKVTFSVSDTGLGIPEADQPKIFDRFFRYDQSRSQDGCGLGLSFARAVARAHGGDISLISKPGQGSTFKITLCS